MYIYIRYVLINGEINFRSLWFFFFFFQVFLAQPVIWGLTYNGQQGVEDVLGIVINEFDNTLALAGRYL